jgi:hypothetical protein
MANCAGARRNFGFLLFLPVLTATAAFGQEVALTFDDLPRTGALPHGMSRVEIANHQCSAKFARS